MSNLKFTSLAAVLAIQFCLVAPAQARGVTIVAESVCDEVGAVINYTATSWSTEAVIGENPDVWVYVNGYQVGAGAFVHPANYFSGSTPAPDGESAHMAAYVNGNWGDGAEGGQTYHTYVDLPADCPNPTGEGRFTGGGHQIRVDGVRVTRGLTLHCDLLLSNNLEINWLGNQFHMLEHMTTIECSDDPEITQAPPAAPLDTMIGVGEGRYNGVEGYTIEFTLVDHGEPGSGMDQAAFQVYETANPANIVLDVPLQVITGGNLQAHYDQPHK